MADCSSSLKTGWGPGWKPSQWGPGWGGCPSYSWGPSWSPELGICNNWRKWQYWDPSMYHNYLEHYPSPVVDGSQPVASHVLRCQRQCELDCNTDNPSHQKYCKSHCKQFCNPYHTLPKSCNNMCFESCYVPGQSMATTCNNMCLGDATCLQKCNRFDRTLDSPGFNSCKRVCNMACQQ